MPVRLHQPHLNSLLAALGLLAAIGLTLYLSLPALTGPFLFDDFPNLERLALLEGSLDWAHIRTYLVSFPGMPGRPLSALSFLINDSAWPTSSFSFKYTNLMLHLLCGVMVFGLVRTLAKAYKPDAPEWLALLTTAAWLLHPMQLSTSMLVVQRMTILSAIFTFAGLWLYTAIVLRGVGALRMICAIATLGLFTVLATLSKENGALTPLLASVINITVLYPLRIRLPALSRRIVDWGTLMPTLALMTAIALNWKALTSYSMRDFNLLERLMTQARILLDYCMSIVLPRMGGAGIYHDDVVVSRSLLEPATTLPSILLILAAIVAAIVFRKRFTIASFAVLWFLASHLFESSVFPLELYFEHRNYVPMLGVLFAMAWAVYTFRRSRLVLLGAGVWIALCAWMLHVQAGVWGNNDKIAVVWAIERPGSPRATQQLADFHLRNGRPREAMRILTDGYARGLRGSDFPLQALLVACQIRDAREAARIAERLPTVLGSAEYNNSVNSSLQRLRPLVEKNACGSAFGESDWWNATEVLLKNPKYNVGKRLSFLRVERAYFMMSQRKLQPTMTELEAAYRADPSLQLSRLIASVLASAGLRDDARQWLKRGLADNRRVRVTTELLDDSSKSYQMLRTLDLIPDKKRTK